MPAVYIIYSKNLDRYYIGSCENTLERLSEHNQNKRKAYTNTANDWEFHYKIDDLDWKTALQIEKHIKRMKSRKYLIDLKKHSAMH
jgi:putative endonuclease